MASIIISRKTSIVAGAVCILLWSALFALFYWGPHEYGRFGSIDFGSVRGASVERFSLASTDTLLASKRAGGAFSGDTLLLAQTRGNDGVTAYVVREENLIFEKSFETTGFEALWNSGFERFELRGQGSKEQFILIPGEHTYILETYPIRQ